jgi:hypothetical protein
MSMGRIHVTFFHTALWIHCVLISKSCSLISFN